MNRDDVIKAVTDFLDNVGYTYERESREDREYIKMGIGIDGALRGVDLVWDFKKSCFIVYTYAPITVPEDKLPEMYKFLALANYGLINGNFELDDGAKIVRYKCYQNMNGINNLPKQVIAESLAVGVQEYEKYQNGIIGIAIGRANAEEMIEEIEGPSE